MSLCNCANDVATVLHTVCLPDLADCIGGGAAGDSMATVCGLLEAGVTEPCLAVVVDPTAAKACVAGMYTRNVLNFQVRCCQMVLNSNMYHVGHVPSGRAVEWASRGLLR
jgi:hypothetical protein